MTDAQYMWKKTMDMVMSCHHNIIIQELLTNPLKICKN